MAVLFGTGGKGASGSESCARRGECWRKIYEGEDEEPKKKTKQDRPNNRKAKLKVKGRRVRASYTPGSPRPAPQRRQGFCWASSRMSAGSPCSGSMPLGEMGGPSAARACSFLKSPLMLTGISMAKKLVEAATD